jgi:hypothetical protein
MLGHRVFFNQWIEKTDGAESLFLGRGEGCVKAMLAVSPESGQICKKGVIFMG